MGNITLVEALVGISVVLLIIALPVALFVWGVRKFAGSRNRESAILERLDSLERGRRAE